MKKKISIYIALIIMATLLMSACGILSSSADVTIPVYSQASADTKLEDLRQQMEDQEKTNLPGYNIEVLAYSTSSTADEVNAFYNDALKDWKVEDPGTVPDGMTFLKWSKSNTVFIVMTIPMPDGSEGLAIFTERAWK